MGGERVPVIFTIVLSALIMLSDINVVRITLGILFWILAMGILRLMAKTDPHLSQIYLRRLKYKAFYPAFSRAYK